MAAAARSVKGVTRTLTSAIISIWIPPSPNTMSGPKEASSTMLTFTSTPFPTAGLRARAARPRPRFGRFLR